MSQYLAYSLILSEMDSNFIFFNIPHFCETKYFKHMNESSNQGSLKLAAAVMKPV